MSGRHGEKSDFGCASYPVTTEPRVMQYAALQSGAKSGAWRKLSGRRMTWVVGTIDLPSA